VRRMKGESRGKIWSCRVCRATHLAYLEPCTG
jgi:hypothetical protein